MVFEVRSGSLGRHLPFYLLFSVSTSLDKHLQVCKLHFLWHQREFTLRFCEYLACLTSLLLGILKFFTHFLRHKYLFFCFLFFTRTVDLLSELSTLSRLNFTFTFRSVPCRRARYYSEFEERELFNSQLFLLSRGQFYWNNDESSTRHSIWAWDMKHDSTQLSTLVCV